MRQRQAAHFAGRDVRIGPAGEWAPTEVEVTNHRALLHFTRTLSRLGTRATTPNVARMQTTPPLTTENCALVAAATTPDSNWPSIGPPITNMPLTALMRPRSSSGVVSWMTRWRRSMLTISAAPAPARKSTAIQRGPLLKPKRRCTRPSP